MLTEIADGVLVHESTFLKSNAVVVQGRAGVLLVDPGIQTQEMTTLASDIRTLGQLVVAGFATHPHWDHVLWHPEFGPAPRYGTAACAADIEDVMARPDWKAVVAQVLPPDIAEDIPLERFGAITPLPAGTDVLPWDGPRVRIVEHRGHAVGHAAVLVEDSGVLVAGDMLSDILMPFLDLEAADPIGDYLAALDRFEGIAEEVYLVIPGHGSVGDRDQLRARIELDRAYVLAMRDTGDAEDPRLDAPANDSVWLPDVHAWQRQQLAERAGGTTRTERSVSS